MTHQYIIENIQKGPSPWYAVGAGVFAALVVTAGNLYVAQRQRRAAAEQFREQLVEAGDRLGRQLQQDSTLRTEEIRAASERLSQQLAQDRDMREVESKAATARLERQLRHDRDLRDLEHLRFVLAPIAARVSDAPTLASIKQRLADAGDDDSARRLVGLEVHEELAEITSTLTEDRVTLMMVLRFDHPLGEAVGSVAQTLAQARDVVGDWRTGAIDSAELGRRLDEQEDELEVAVSAAMTAAYAMTGRAEDEPSADVSRADS